MKKFLTGIFFLLAFFLTTSNVLGAETERIIVKFRRFTPSVLTGETEKLKLKDTYVLKVSKGSSVRIIEALRKNFNVEYAEGDAIALKLETPNDPGFGSQWGLTKIKAPGAWDATHGGGSVDIAIVDTGININHPDLGGKIALSINCTLSGCPVATTTDPDGHGTHVAGIASAITNNGIGVAGLSWDGRLMSVKSLDDNGSGYYSWIANGIIAATDAGAEVINLSLGGTSSSYTLESAVNYAWSHGVVVVAAAGNNGRNRRLYPGFYTNAIAVAATDQNDKKASFSNYGSWVEVAAPGVSIYSTYGSGYTNLSGTSMSTPFVSGLAALIFGQNSGWTNSQVRNQIQSTADAIAGTGRYWTYGRINACAAVGCVENLSTPAPTQTPSASPEPTATAGTPTPTSSPTIAPTATPTPSPSSLPWWCKYVPDHSTCQ